MNQGSSTPQFRRGHHAIAGCQSSRSVARGLLKIASSHSASTLYGDSTSTLMDNQHATSFSSQV